MQKFSTPSGAPEDIFNSTDPEIIHTLVQSIFSSTKCYDLMQNSSKAIVFETTIPFQLAFFALVEHDADIAPMWDPERRQFVGLMSVGDYIHALRIWRAQSLPGAELTSKTISDMMESFCTVFKHNDYQAVDAEDSVLQMCTILLRNECDYLPVIDGDNGNLVSILGLLDVVHLLYQAATQYPNLFARTVREWNIGTYHNILKAPKTARICDVLDALEQKNVSGMPVLDENSKVVGFYHRSDVSFIIKATDTDMVINNLNTYKVEECMALRDQLLQSGDILSSFQGLVTCKPGDQMSTVLGSMVRGRSCRAVVVDEANGGQCLGVLTIRDIIKHFLSSHLD